MHTRRDSRLGRRVVLLAFSLLQPKLHGRETRQKLALPLSHACLSCLPRPKRLLGLRSGTHTDVDRLTLLLHLHLLFSRFEHTSHKLNHWHVGATFHWRFHCSSSDKVTVLCCTIRYCRTEGFGCRFCCTSPASQDKSRRRLTLCHSDGSAHLCRLGIILIVSLIQSLACRLPPCLAPVLPSTTISCRLDGLARSDPCTRTRAGHVIHRNPLSSPLLLSSVSANHFCFTTRS